ncbi:MAG: LysM peptidoglycan-binding domain-containing protein [Amphritea sp.]
MGLVNKIVVLATAGLLISGCQNNAQFKPDSPMEASAEKADASSLELMPAQPVLEQPAPVTDLWTLTRDNLALNLDQNQARLKTQFNWYNSHPQYMQRVTQRASRYYYYILSEVLKRGMPAEVALLPIVESAYDPFAYSHGRAAGAWQFIPGTARHFGLKSSWWYDGRRDIVASTDAALTYLQQLNKRFDGDWELALAAYNCGGGNVSKAIRHNKQKGLPTDYWSLNLPKETQAYIPKLLAVAKLIRDAEQHKLELPALANQPVFQIIELDSQIDLAQAAELASISTQELYQLNPGFNRWATDPEGPHRLLIPVEKANLFRTKLAALPIEQRVNWTRYKIKSGDAISTIARRYNTTTAVIRSANKMQNNKLRAGRYLLIPTARNQSSDYVLSQTQRYNRKQSQLANSNRKKQTYTVRSGDSFWVIARKFDVSVRQLASWNQMAPGDTLRSGQQLAIWKAITTTALAPSDQKIIRSIGYQVRSGDSLARIAGKFRVSIKDIQRWNKLTGKKYLQPGQRLTLYVDITNTY